MLTENKATMKAEALSYDRTGLNTVYNFEKIVTISREVTAETAQIQKAIAPQAESNQLLSRWVYEADQLVCQWYIARHLCD